MKSTNHLKIIWSAALVLSMALLTGGSVAQDADLRMLASAGSSGKAYRAIAELFTAKTGITVQIEEMPLADLRQKQILDLATGAGQIDVVVVNNRWIEELGSQLVDLQPHMTTGDGFDAEAIVPSMLAMFAKDGKQFALPVRVGGRVLAYRADLFEAAGIAEPPRTWTEFVEIAKKLTDPSKGQYGFVAPLRQSTNMVDTWAAFVTSFGSDFVDETGLNPAFNNAAGLAATQTFVDLYRTNGVMSPDAIEYEDDGAISAMQSGRAAMFIAYSPWISQLNDPAKSQVAGNVRVAPYMPTNDGQGGVSMTNGWGFGVSARSDAQAEALAFVKFAASAEAQLAAALTANNDPTISEIYNNPEYLQHNPSAVDILSALEGAKAQPSSPGWTAVSEELTRSLSLAITGQQTSEEAINEVAGRAVEMLSR